MKKISAILIALLLVATAASGGNVLEKKGNSEVSVSYGQFTLTQFAFTTASVLGIVISGGNLTFDNFVLAGQVSAEYYYYLGNVIAVGATLTNDFMKADSYNSAGAYQGKFDADFLSLMPGVKASWFNHQKFGMYSKLNVGVSALVSSEFNVSLALQLSPVCCEFGGANLRGFAELGVGDCGIINLGIKYCFARR